MVKNLTVNVLSVRSCTLQQNDAVVEKKIIHNLIKELKKKFAFNIISIQINFVDSKEIMNINKEYLNHNYSTDIITFDYSASLKNLEGEIYISLDDAAHNAKKYGVSFKEEIIRLVIHGFLHILGFNDQSQREKTVMKRLENQLLNQYKSIV